MIQINNNPVVGSVIQHKYCSTIYTTNYSLCSVEFLELVDRISYITNTISYYPDLICVISNDDLDELIYELVRVSSFVKIEQGV